MIKSETRMLRTMGPVDSSFVPSSQPSRDVEMTPQQTIPEGRWSGTAWPLIFCIGLVAHVSSFSAASRAQEVNDRIIIQQRIQTNYEQFLPALGPTLMTAGQRKVVVRSGDSISKIISEQFRVDQSRAPSAYAAISDFIVVRSGLTDPNTVNANREIVVPDIPPAALTEPNPLNPWNSIPKLAIGENLQSSFSDVLQKSFTSNRVTKPLLLTYSQRPASQEALVYRDVTFVEALSITAVSEETKIVSAPIRIAFQQAGANQGGIGLSDASAEYIRAALEKAPNQKPTLIILDDSWPDAETFRLSRDFFVKSIHQIQERMKVPQSQFSKNLKSADTANWLSQNQALLDHASWIKTALAPFRSLEPPDGRVNVVYLPMFVRQEYAGELLAQIISLDQIMQAVSPPYDNTVPSDVVRRSRQSANEIVSRIARNSEATTTSTDVGLIQAVLAFCEAFSRATSEACFVNMSWTAPNLHFRARVPDEHFGVFVAAAGNEGGGPDNLYTLRRQFAVRSAVPPGDVLAVINIDETGRPACGSTELDENLSIRFAVAFSGAVQPGICGTSFAAPRVAWLLAAREAMRPKPLSETAWLSWRDAIHQTIQQNFNGQASDYNRIRLQIDRLF